MEKKRLVLTFPPKLVNQPITYRLIKDFDLVINILKARVTPNEEGRLLIEISGGRKDLKGGLSYLKGLGVEIQPLAKDIIWNEKRCTHCTLCIPICPSGALSVDREKMLVSFTQEKCIACGLCVTVCPYNAIQLRL